MIGQLTYLGTGTSMGVPTLGCQCAVCTSPDPHDRRLRPSILLRWNEETEGQPSRERVVVIDTGPDFRQQALRAGLPRVDAVFFTHGHADHILGLDDLRPFNFLQREAIPVYASEETLTIVRRVFDYIIHAADSQSSRPRIRTHAFNGAPIEIAGLGIMPVPVLHGRGACHGFRFGKAAYLTDHSEVPEESLAMLENLDVLFLDALRYKPHPTHNTVEQSLRLVELLKPRQTWFTHIAHDLPHERAERLLPAGVRLAYDGREVVVGS